MHVKWNLSSLLGKYRARNGVTLTYKTINAELAEMYGASIDMMTISRMVNNNQPLVSIRNLTMLIKYFSEKLGEPVGLCDILIQADGDEEVKTEKRTRKKRKPPEEEPVKEPVKESEKLRSKMREEIVSPLPSLFVDSDVTAKEKLRREEQIKMAMERTPKKKDTEP